jgi:hypothetical protein
MPVIRAVLAGVGGMELWGRGGSMQRSGWITGAQQEAKPVIFRCTRMGTITGAASVGPLVNTSIKPDELLTRGKTELLAHPLGNHHLVFGETVVRSILRP